MTDLHAQRPATPPSAGAVPPAPAHDVARHVPLGELFAGQVRRDPDAPAVTDGRDTWSYGELAHRAGRLAAHLAAGGAGPERTVALVLPRSIELIAAELAVALAGAAFLPVDPAYPAERRELMLADAAPAVVLDDLERVRALLDDEGGEIDLPPNRVH
ncbi:AMP-binding protein, partial [Streptomyces populi]